MASRKFQFGPDAASPSVKIAKAAKRKILRRTETPSASFGLSTMPTGGCEVLEARVKELEDALRFVRARTKYGCDWLTLRRMDEALREGGKP